MARVTVEDCIEKIPSRFDLVMAASQRAREIAAGAPLTIERNQEKNPVIALREIGQGTIDVDELQEKLVLRYRKEVEEEESEEEIIELMEAEKEWAALTDKSAAKAASPEDAEAKRQGAPEEEVTSEIAKTVEDQVASDAPADELVKGVDEAEESPLMDDDAELGQNEEGAKDTGGE
jgi:DNA-directed RNA polymerase subunit omega